MIQVQCTEPCNFALSKYYRQTPCCIAIKCEHNSECSNPCNTSDMVMCSQYKKEMKRIKRSLAKIKEAGGKHCLVCIYECKATKPCALFMGEEE